jgi:phosphonopyruvate decarboxylase
MITAAEFVQAGLPRGYSFWTGVPCSFLTPFINYVIGSPELTYIAAASEGEAVGIAAGAYLAGRRTVVLCQNSGLGNMVNPLTSLNYPFRIPTLVIASHRGAPGTPDEPQHELMGRITGGLFDLMEIPWEPFPQESAAVGPTLDRADAAISSGRCYGLVMPKGSVAKYSLAARVPPLWAANTLVAGRFDRSPGDRPSRMEAIRIIRDAADDNHDAVIATTGMICRELFALGRRANQIYLVGSMGCASAVGLGLHEASGRKTAIVLDGDGAALMKAGTLATIGHRAAARFIHVILDNEKYESTGGQATSSPTVDFCTMASGASYRHAWRADTAEEVAAAVLRAKQVPGPNLIHVKVRTETCSDVGRPNVTPETVKREFMEWLAR